MVKKPARRRLVHPPRQGLDRMIPGFVHQFRTPLAVIRSSADNLMANPALPAGLRPELDMIQRNAMRLQNAVQNLLAYAKGDPIPWSDDSVNLPLSRVIDYLKEACAKRQVSLVPHLAAALPPVRMQPSLLEEAFCNLSVNALEACSAGGTLEITSALLPDGQTIGVRIADTGAGMNAAQRRRFGKPYATGKKGGLGLGVYFAMRILKSHEALVRVESELEKGTTVTLLFRAS